MGEPDSPPGGRRRPPLPSFGGGTTTGTLPAIEPAPTPAVEAVPTAPTQELPAASAVPPAPPPRRQRDRRSTAVFAVAAALLVSIALAIGLLQRTDDGAGDEGQSVASSSTDAGARPADAGGGPADADAASDESEDATGATRPATGHGITYAIPAAPGWSIGPTENVADRRYTRVLTGPQGEEIQVIETPYDVARPAPEYVERWESIAPGLRLAVLDGFPTDACSATVCDDFVLNRSDVGGVAVLASDSGGPASSVAATLVDSIEAR